MKLLRSLVAAWASTVPVGSSVPCTAIFFCHSSFAKPPGIMNKPVESQISSG